jgi:hypothetical protein
MLQELREKGSSNARFHRIDPKMEEARENIPSKDL